MEGLLQPTHLIVILGVALLLFGPKKLPELGEGLGKGIRGFKDALKGLGEDARGPGPREHSLVSSSASTSLDNGAEK
jgi:sec-independent protein translocase protein TatA